MPAHIKLVTIVVHYGDPALTARVVAELNQSVPGQAGVSGQQVHEPVRVLDNCAPLSYEGEGQWLRLDANMFWAGAFAVALAEARKLGATHLWLCNNDISMDSPPPYIPRMAARLARLDKLSRRNTPHSSCMTAHPVGIVAPSVRRNPYHPQMVHRPGLAFSRVNCVDGIAPLVSLACVDAVGGLDADDNPRGYGVDVWLSLRASRAGWPVLVDHSMVLRHDYHTTARTLPSFMTAAAMDEDRYLTARMGADWRTQLISLHAQRIDETEL